MSADIFVRPGERGIIFGQTGSGKSVMLQEQARRATAAPVIVMDTKIDEGFEQLANERERSEIVENQRDFKKWLEKPRRKMPDYLIVRPKSDEVTDPDVLDGYAQMAYNLQHCYFLVDEAYQLHKNGQALPGLVALLTRGRSRKIGVVLCTQRPKWISLFCLTESSKFLVFYLQLADDRARIAEVIPYNRKLNPEKYHFYFYDTQARNSALRYFAPLDIPARNVHDGGDFVDINGRKIF